MLRRKLKSMMLRLWSTCRGWCTLWWLCTQFTVLFTTSTSQPIRLFWIPWWVPSICSALSRWLPSCTSTTSCSPLSICPRKQWSTGSSTRSLTTCFRSSLLCPPCTDSAASEMTWSLWFISTRGGSTGLTKREAFTPQRNKKKSKRSQLVIVRLQTRSKAKLRLRLRRTNEIN